MTQMEGLQGGRCKWWQILAGFALFAAAPLTAGITAPIGAVVGVTACNGW
jgi:hypothetical protein